MGMLPPVRSYRPLAVIAILSLVWPFHPMGRGSPPAHGIIRFACGMLPPVRSYRPLAAIAVMSIVWPFHPMGRGSPPVPGIIRYACGMLPPVRRHPPLAVIAILSIVWPFHPMGRGSPPALGIGRYACGMLPPVRPYPPLAAITVLSQVWPFHPMGRGSPPALGIGRYACGMWYLFKNICKAAMSLTISKNYMKYHSFYFPISWKVPSYSRYHAKPTYHLEELNRFLNLMTAIAHPAKTLLNGSWKWNKMHFLLLIVYFTIK